MAIKRKDLLIVVCFALISYNNGVDGQFSNESHPLLASLFNVARNQATGKTNGKVQDVNSNPVEILPPITAGAMALDITCGLCMTANDLKCRAIHCVNTELPSGKSIAPLTRTKDVLKGPTIFDSQLKNPADLIRNRPNGITDGSQPIVSIEPRPLKPLSSNVPTDHTRKVIQALPLSWTKDTRGNQMNELPHAIPDGQIPVDIQLGQLLAPSQMFSNKQNVPIEPVDKFQPNKPHNVDMAVREAKTRLNLLFAGTNSVDNKSRQTPITPGQPLVPLEQPVGIQHNNNVKPIQNDVVQKESIHMSEGMLRNFGLGHPQSSSAGIPSAIQSTGTFGDESVHQQSIINQQVPLLPQQMRPKQQPIENNSPTIPGFDIRPSNKPNANDVVVGEAMSRLNSLFMGQNGVDSQFRQKTFMPGQPVVPPKHPTGTAVVPSTSVDVSDQSSPSRGGRNGVPLSIPVVTLPGESGPMVVGINGQILPTINTGRTEDEMQNTVSATIQDFFPVGNLDWDSTSNQTFTKPNHLDASNINLISQRGLGTVPVDLNMLIKSPFDNLGKGETIPTRNIDFTDFGFGPIAPQTNDPATDVELHNTISLETNPAPITLPNELSTHETVILNGRHEINGGKGAHAMTLREINSRPIAGGNNAQRVPSIEHSQTDIGFQNMNSNSVSNHMETIPLNVINGNEPVTTENNNVRTLESVPLPSIHVKNIDNSVNNNHNLNVHFGENTNHPPQNMHFVNFVHGTEPDGTKQFMDISNGFGMDFGNIAQTDSQEQFETPTPMQTLSPRRQNELNNMSEVLLGEFKLKLNH